MIRVASNLETIIPLVKAQIASTNAVLDSSRIFASLADDKDLMERSPADRFVAIKPLDFPVWEEAVTGGGNDLLWFDGEWEITLFVRYGIDADFADDQYLFDPVSGILPQWSAIIHNLQLFDPVNSAGNGVLNEPMRIASRGFRNMPRRTGGVATWGRLKSWWEVKYTHVV